MDPKVVVDIGEVRNQIETYMSVRMETLTEQKVTRLLEFVIRGHLGWLIVWGNVFGAIIGAFMFTPVIRTFLVLSIMTAVVQESCQKLQS